MWPAIIGAAAGLAGDLFGANSARQGQEDANRTNLQIAREQMGFQREMSDTSYQRSVADLRKAGLNPMLALMKGGASTPPGASTRVESETAISSGIMSGAMRKMIDALLLSAQTANVQANTRATEVGTTIAEAKIPHAASSAIFENEKLANEVVRLGQEIERADIDIKMGKLTLEQAEKLMPLMVRAQELVNQGLERGIDRKELESNVAKMFNVPFEYGKVIIDKLGEFGSGLGRSAAELKEWVQTLPDRVKDYDRRR